MTQRVRIASAGAGRKTRRIPVAILPILEGDLESGLSGGGLLPEAVLEQLARAAGAEAHRGAAGRILTLHLPTDRSIRCVLLVGLGPAANFTADLLRAAMGDAARRVPEGLRKEGSAVVILDTRRPPWGAATPGAGKAATRRSRRRREEEGTGEGPSLAPLLQALAEGWILGSYAHTRFQTRKRRPGAPNLDVHVAGRPDTAERDLRAALRRGEIVADGVVLARDLANAPANAVHPLSLSRRARQLARATGLSCRVLDEPAIRREKMGALLGVAQGSDFPPRFIVLRYTPRGKGRGEKPLVLVGKAITFDSGGLSIKPAKGMEEMKADMSGGAAVLAALGAIARLKPPRPVIGVIPCAENMISGGATRPGDVVTSRAGLTIEVVNTDAEGRLILADALDYVQQFRPRLVVDLATLTGACVVALGDVASGLIANDPRAAEAVERASSESGEKVWRLPLHREYFEALRSHTADVKNSGGRSAGAITAAAFLSRFTEDVPWAHIDIAGPAWSSKAAGYLNKGATGVGVRTLVALALGAGGPARER